MKQCLNERMIKCLNTSIELKLFNEIIMDREILWHDYYSIYAF